MAHYNQFIFLLLAAGYINCLQQFPLKDGNKLEDKYNELKNSLISQSQCIQAQNGLDTIMDAALVLARKKLEINDFINLPNMSLGTYKLIQDIKVGNLSTIARAGNVIIANDIDGLTLNVLLKMKLESNFSVPMDVNFIYNYTAQAPKTTVGATIKLDYSKEKCRIVVDDVEIDFNDSLTIKSLDLPTINRLFFTYNGVIETVRANLESSVFQPSALKPMMKTQLDKALNKYLNCEDLKPMYRS